jgi:hypothetical protein
MQTQQEMRIDALRSSASEACEQLTAGTLEASPGVTWGFGGVHTLACTQAALWIVTPKLTVRLRGANRVHRVGLSDIHEADLRTRRSILPFDQRLTLLRFTAKGRKKRYAIKDFAAATQLFDALRGGAHDAQG